MSPAVKSTTNSDGAAIIGCDAVSLYYPGNPETILAEITWHIGAGEHWVLYGPNGSGKTKLLEIITGYLYPSMGSVRRFGDPPGDDIREVRRRIGYLSTPLKDRFNRSEPLIDVVMSGAYATIGLYDTPGTGQRDRARTLLESVGFSTKLSQAFGTLSDGERQKVLMLRTMMIEPDLLILDEPCMGLDLSAREELLSSIKTICGGTGTAVVYVTHHVEEITPFFTKIFMLKKGRCWFCGDIDAGLTDAAISGLFGRNISIIKKEGRFYATLG